MANLKRVRVGLRGAAVVGPSVSTFYFSAAHTGFNADLVAFYTSLAGSFPNVLYIDVPASGDTVDEVTGEIVGTWTDGSDTTVIGTGTSVFAMGVGARVVWLTNGINNGRRIRGSTFLVPIDGLSLSVTGDLGAARATMQTAAATLEAASAGGFHIWTRPVGGAGGGSTSVIGSSVPDKVTTLRSRRI